MKSKSEPFIFLPWFTKQGTRVVVVDSLVKVLWGLSLLPWIFPAEYQSSEFLVVNKIQVQNTYLDSEAVIFLQVCFRSFLWVFQH